MTPHKVVPIEMPCGHETDAHEGGEMGEYCLICDFYDDETKETPNDF